MPLSNFNSLNILPSFGASASFSSLLDSVSYGDNLSQRTSRGINSLSMKLSLQFDTLTDNQSHSVIDFFESQFDYETQIYVNNGSFSNRRVEPFEYQPFYPYKNNKFNCFEFSHSKVTYDVNNISATFLAISNSTLDSIESGPDHNSEIDAVININSIDGSNSSSVAGNDVKLKSGNVIFHSGDYINATLSEDFIVDNGSSANLSATSVPNSSWFGNDPVSVNHTDIRHSIYLLEPNDCSYYPYAPIHADGNLDCRMFDFRPTTETSFNHSPKYKKSSANEQYAKYSKYGFNPNLLNLNLSFDNLSDLEAKSILLFLESHLGYKKFGFHPSKDYVNYGKVRFFYCPEWTHTLRYKDNHNISATFIECINY